MTDSGAIDDDSVDAGADAEIVECLKLDAPRSFFLFAGAGSGKTRSLTEALKKVLPEVRKHLRLHRQQIAVITYTNAACDEVRHRTEFDPLVKVSTIHSFVWSQIDGYTADIKAWLEQELNNNIAELEEKERKGRGGKASLKRQRDIRVKSERLSDLPSIRKFTYNPDGDNFGRDSLNHAEVISIGANFLTTKPLMQRILVNAFPIILVDESQDTHRPFMEALFDVQCKQRDKFSLGLIGDTMQRIYGHGLASLGQNIPPDWSTPAKAMNHRSPKRVIELINRIREPVDGRQQQARSDAEEGTVRLFIAVSGESSTEQTEQKLKARMAEVTGDDEWSNPEGDLKVLALEHHMTARRLGFSELFESLAVADRLRTGLLDGTLPGLRLFSERVQPVIASRQSGDEFAVAAIFRKWSDLLGKKTLSAAGDDQTRILLEASAAVDCLVELFGNGAEPSFLDVLHVVAETNLFPIPEALQPFSDRSEAALFYEVSAALADVEDDDREELSKTTRAWGAFLLTPYSQIAAYRDYVNGLAAYDTHQGVKGREFDRVFVIVDDAEARGFLFPYEKLFGAKDKSATDLKNEQENKETGIDRARRLLYVTCSRAMQSLAVIIYSEDPRKVREYVLRESWFEEHEVELL